MMIKQLSIFIQNEPGSLEMLTKILGDNEINICACSLAETPEYGILRMIASDPDRAASVLKENSYTVKVHDVICLVTPDIPGELNKALRTFAKEGINVSYMYGYSSDGKARLILKVNEPEKAAALLEQ